jgi:GNAT superfamily N-acetyltransferase
VPVLFGWWRGHDTGRGPAQDGTPVAGAFVDNPPYPVVLSGMPPAAARALAADLAGIGRAVAGVNARPPDAAAFAAGWREATGSGSRLHRQMRLHRLAGLLPPAPAPGRPRTAGAGDRGLLLEWQVAFQREVHELATARPHEVDDRLGYGGFTLWEVDAGAVSMAGVSRAVAGMVRVGPVYTPPEHRGLGYAGAVTAAISRSALDAGAHEVVLFTDLDNPTSNALYRRIGYQPVSDRSVLSFTPPGPDPGPA